MGIFSSSSGYDYNGRGDRVRQTVDGLTTTYTLDLAIGLTQVLADNDNTYLYGLNRLGQESTEGWIYHHSDALGSVRQLTDSDGAVVFSQSYQPYGDVFPSVGSKLTDYGFSNEYTSQGLIYLRARYYDPYHDSGIRPYEAKQSTIRLKHLQRQAARLGMQLAPLSAD